MALVKRERPQEPYVFQPYPKWKYHPTMQPVQVHSAAAELALGDGWVDNPGEFAPDTGPEAIDPADHQGFYKIPMTDLIERIDAMGKADIPALLQLRAIEVANPDKKNQGGRPKVMQAFNEKLEALSKEETEA